MPVDLILLDGVSWQGAPVVGERSRALLAALALGGGRPVRSDRLVEAIWGAAPPANAAKALQVVVSRTRAACGADLVVLDAEGYRLGVEAERVDSAQLTLLAARARRALDEDPALAADLAREAVALAGAPQPDAAGDDDDEGPLPTIARSAADDVRSARTVLARAQARTGEHAAAIGVLEVAHTQGPDDESLLADLLLSEAGVRGPSAALERYEEYRRGLRDRLGTSPGAALQRVQRDLLAADRPVREGVRYDTTTLLGRDEDVRRLRALVQSSRVVSIVGAGGLGKTRLAHVIAREATQPVVHVVELVGVTAPDDLVGELGSALGVRDSVSGRRVLTPDQRADVRARIAQHLGQAPSLLILDNCEHLVEAVAGLVAFLVAGTADLHVLTTTRAPLAIAAERVYPLAELQTTDAVELFRQRAVAARPGVRLDDVVVEDIATRLDGLPLAIELAAAKVRVMAVEDISRRLENRFALLRGGDRSAPDRHQTLLAVIDWSWNLLEEDERRALRRLSVFHDGFTLDAAEAVLGDGALAAVQSLADQSLLTVSETAAGVRHRMLETVREFGRMQLVDAGEDGPARVAHRDWARAYARTHGARLFGLEEFAAIDAIAEEENNLADALRQALADDTPDPGAVVELVAGLGGFWTIRGNHVRMLVLIDPVSDALDGWDPPPQLVNAVRAATILVLGNGLIIADDRTGPMRELLGRVGADGGEPALAATARVMLAYHPGDTMGFAERLQALSADPHRHTARVANQWLGHFRENAGDPASALEAVARARALTRPEDGPWAAAILETQLAELTAHMGDAGAAQIHARSALEVLVRLGAHDDVTQLHALLILAAIVEGRLDDAARAIESTEAIEDSGTLFGGRMTMAIRRAELDLARGDHAPGLAAYLDVVADTRTIAFPGIEQTGVEPWVLFGEATALTAFAHYGASAEDDAHGRALYASCRERLERALTVEELWRDYPAMGLVLFGLAAWALLQDAAPPEEAARLLVLAEAFAYSRSVSTMAWEGVAPLVEAQRPGLLDELRAEYGERRGPQLREDAALALARLPV